MICDDDDSAELITVRDLWNLWKCLNDTVLGLQVKHSRTTEA